MKEVTKFSATTVEELDKLADLLCRNAAGGELWCFSGDLGAGKTELIRRIVHRLSPAERVTSPTYNLENRYPAGNFTVSHWDLYRLRALDNLPDLDEQIGDKNFLLLVEWPERYSELETRADIFITITVVPGSETREIEIRTLKKA